MLSSACQKYIFLFLSSQVLLVHKDQWEGFCDLALKFSKPVSSLGPRDLQLGREVW